MAGNVKVRAPAGQMAVTWSAICADAPEHMVSILGAVQQDHPLVVQACLFPYSRLSEVYKERGSVCMCTGC